jgi:hypothetical protein
MWFQKIIYDGLVGRAFLRNFVVTFDVPNERLIFLRSPRERDRLSERGVVPWPRRARRRVGGTRRRGPA